jgi:hypothetical protein
MRAAFCVLTLGMACAVAPSKPSSENDLAKLMANVKASKPFQQKVAQACSSSGTHQRECTSKAQDVLFCQLLRRQDSPSASQAFTAHCGGSTAPSFLELGMQHLRSSGPEDDLAREMTHDLEMNFNKIAPFGKEDTAKELQDHAAKTQDTLVDAVENAEVAEIKRAVFRALTRLRAATIKEFDTIARLETQAIDAYNDAHHYRAENPLAHLHEDEAPVETDKLKSFH